MTPFESYTTFLALKNHFTTDNYDYIKYNGKVGAKPSSFDTRKDKYDCVIVKNGQHPYLLKQYLRREISIETVIILNDIFGFFGHWNKKIEDGVLWPSIHKKLLKYKPFFHYDAFKCRKIVKDVFTS